MWPIQEVTYIGLLYMIWSPVRNLGMATLEQSDLVFRRFIRPLGPFGLVKHEVKPRLEVKLCNQPCWAWYHTPYFNTYGRGDQSAYLLVVTTALHFFSPSVCLSNYFLFSKAWCMPPLCKLSMCGNQNAFQQVIFFYAFPLTGFNSGVSVQ